MIAVMRMLAGGRSGRERVRAWLVGGGAALATFLLCTAASLVDLKDEGSSLTGLGMAILAVPIAAMLHQANRLAAATRERRLAALRLAGATPNEVRLLGAYESGWLHLLGALAGAAVYVLSHLGGALLQVPVFVALVVVSGLWSGAVAGRHVVASPLGVVRRARARGPRATDLLLIALGLLMFYGVGTARHSLYFLGKYGWATTMAAGMVLLLFGLTLAASWLIRAMARQAARRGTSPETLLAARLVEDDPRGWARAMSVVGLAVFFGAGSGTQQAAVGSYLHAHALIDVALVVALTAAAVALVVRQAESLLDQHRSFAALAATGVSERDLGRVLVRQAVLASVPVCVVAAVAGVVAVIAPLTDAFEVSWLGWASARAVAMAGIGVVSAILVALAARPLLRAAIRPERLRADRANP